ncbi:DUF2325 domain-containing protein [Cellulosilyticum sp. I15G10I2]|uniref:DUF2325 domain-containing protein n=1 Tax=Cellulosilyticum sp. I15G10I2 TaxID=1892843 RepID=UPI00085C9545|nr:DUF2325 domain-containing protein [Cellulosilyticum sp. I15G10I2]
MSIVLVGGHDRMHEAYKGICSKRGHRVKVYTQLPARFDKMIGTPDGIVLFTGTVSHKMMHIAVKEAKRKNIPIVRCHNSSGNSLESILEQFEKELAVASY